MAEAVVEFSLGTIRDLLVDEFKLISGVSSQVKDVQAELQQMKCFLEDVDKRKYEEKSVQNFVKEIRNLSYRIEDVVETYAAKAILERRKWIKNFLNQLACSSCKCYSIHEVGTEINDIKKEIANLISRMGNYGIQVATLEGGESSSEKKSERRKWLRKTYAHGLEEHFVGMTEDIITLVKMLLDDDRKHRVVSICGMGGLGKTTLAKKIYHHGDIKGKFKVFAWVCVSQDCNLNIVLKDLLKQLLPKAKPEIDAMGETELVGAVYNALKEEKCLVVVDDIWHVDDWRSLSHAFPIAEGNSKILITTRKEDVAKVGFPHYLGLLSEDEGWELLQKKAFVGRDPKDLNVEQKILEHIGREMVHKCGSLPLAISVLGGILSGKKSFDSWEMVNKDIDLYLRRRTGNEGEEAIKQVLSLSYDDLPYHLKPCFLCLSCFPEDKDIDAGELYLLWIGERMVSSRDQEKEETLVDVARRYLGELASRSMVQVQVDEFLAPEKFKSCRLHDLLRDLCLEKSKEEDFLNLMDFRGGKRPSSMSLLASTSFPSWRLAIYMDKNLDGVSLVGKLPHELRSLQLHMHEDFPPILQVEVINDVENLKSLRVLKFQRIRFEGKMSLNGIGKLILLRSLVFQRCDAKKLPSSIGDLPFLHTIVLEFINSLEIPNVFCRIKRLRYLYLPSQFFTSSGKLRLGGLDELEVLNGFNSESCESIDLSKLKCLQRLQARCIGKDNLFNFIDSIEVKGKHLETSLEIRGCDFHLEEERILLRKVFMNCSIQDLNISILLSMVKLPEYEPGFCPNLETLYLDGISLFSENLEDPMNTLEKLPKLKHLYLRGSSFVGREMVCHARGFPQLRVLELVSLKNLVKWIVEEGAMPCLLQLTISFFCKLEMVPEGLRFITSLQRLEIKYMPKKFMKRVEEGGEDFDKVKHVDSILILEMSMIQRALYFGAMSSDSDR